MRRCYLNAVSLLLLQLSLIVVPSTVANAQAYKEAVGYNALVLEQGASLEDGTGIVVMQPEAGTNYMPNAANGQFSGKTFTNGTGTSSDPSSHATSVGVNFYGNSSSMTPGILDITGYGADDYLGNILDFNTGGDPLAQTFDVGNHSYIGTGLTTAETIDLGQRFDFVINRDNTVMVVGTNNGSGNSTPDLLATSFNAITVGRTDGNHARGPTAKYGPGRIKPDIVAPQGTTSGATPVVSSAAALLREAGAGTNAIENQVIKSILFAGATKDEFPDWDRTTSRPIDDVFGFGELNILNSYRIWEGGEFAASTSDPATNVDLLGWDYGDFNGTNDLFYDFEIIAGQTAAELSAVLVWNIDVIDSKPSPNNFDASTVLADLDLELYDSTGSFMGSLLDSSLSTDYNHEHIYLKDLPPGNYTFRISGDLAVDYGFSWRIDAVPGPLSSFAADFDSLIPAPTGDPIGDGWRFLNTNGPDPDYFGQAPNGPQISALEDDGAGNQYLHVFADYDNPNLATNALTLRVFQEQTFTGADAALGATRTFRFDYAKADDPFGVGGSTTTGAFIRVLDDSLNLLDEAVLDTTGATGPAFAPGSVSLTFDPAWTTGGIVQFGFTSTVMGSDPSGVYYDHVHFFVLGDANDDGIVDFTDVNPFITALFDQSLYLIQFPGVDPDVVLDMNNDGVLDFLDVSGFLAALGF